MTANALELYPKFLSRLIDLRGPDKKGNLSACCPITRHRSARLSLLAVEDRLLFHCWAHCENKHIVQALGCIWADCYRPKNDDWQPEHRRVVGRWFYRDEQNRILYWVERLEPGKYGGMKDFRYCRTDPRNGDKVWNLDGVRRVPYRLPELLAAPKEPILIVEGEGKAEILRSLGFQATTTICGARGWRDEYAALLKGREIAVWPDAGEPGNQYGRDVAGSCLFHGVRSLRIVQPAGLANGEDVKEFLLREGVGMSDQERHALILCQLRSAQIYKNCAEA